ncbi:MAG: alcohol dehydrogenase catalytic domain-containing protein [Sphaerochaeta sp.]|nr:alcohol dehydrogenase catalytic domain-containing protein [Sphaerochaeta sp.]
MNSKTMKSAVLRQFGQPLTIEEKPIPVPGSGEVLVKVCASGLCVSDLHIQDGMIGTVRLPYTPGHEMAGVVAQVGEGVTAVAIGDHVVGAIDITCGTCKYCLSGRTNLCRNLVRVGFERDGSHEEYCVIPAANAFKVANWVPFDQMTSITDAVGCMYNAIKNRAKVQPGQRVLILGTGGLGMNAIQIAKIFGATVYATSRQKEKLDISLEMGADAAINTKEQNLYDEIVRLTDGEMCDVVIDNIGIKSSINDSLRLMCPGGRVIVAGYNDPTFEAEYQDIMKFEKEILGIRGMTKQDLVEVIGFIETGKIVPFIYKTIPFDRINEGLNMLRTGEAKGRVVLMMDQQ